jgi:hypothetical protein
MVVTLPWHNADYVSSGVSMQALRSTPLNLRCAEPRNRGSAPVLLDGHSGTRQHREAELAIAGNAPAGNPQRDASGKHQVSHLKHRAMASLTDERHVDVEPRAQRAQKCYPYKEGVWQHKGTT